MDHNTRGQALDTTYEQSIEDHHDAMEVDSAPAMMLDTDHSQDLLADNSGAPVDSHSELLSVTSERPANEQSNEPMSLSNQSHNLASTPAFDAPRNALYGSREPPAFDEDTERPRQRRRYHVTAEDDTDAEIRPTTDNAPATGGTSEDDEVAALEAAPPRLSDLSINTPRSTSPPPATTINEQAPMVGVVSDSAAPVPSAPSNADQGSQSPHLNTIPLPDVQPPSDPNNPPDPVMQAARRLTTAPDINSDQMQSDLALLAPYIAAQAMAAAFPPPPPAGHPPAGGAPNPGNATADGQQQQQGQGGTNPADLPPLPFLFGLAPFMFGGGNTEAPADPKRAERLANGLKVVEEGLLKRWKSVCGDEGAVCAVCYGELLEEPGIEQEKEKDAAKELDKAAEAQADENQQGNNDEDLHERELRDALKRRELMEKLEKEEKEHKLETAVLAFPCGHVFHRTCLLPWLSRHTTCPTCRFDIDPKSDTLTLPAEDELPPFLGPNGFNFGDFFTVGPVLRVPRTHAPGLGPRPGPRSGHTHEDGQGHGHEHDLPNQPNNNNTAPRPPTGASRPMTNLFDSLLRPLFQQAGPAPPQQPATAAEGSAQESAAQETSAQGTNAQGSTAPGTVAEASAAQRSAPQEAAAQGTAPQETAAQVAQPSQERSEVSQPPPVVTPSVATPSAPAPVQGRTLDHSRPLAMFGRPSPRRPPQPITPAWMRPAQPPTTATPLTTAAGLSRSTATTSNAAAPSASASSSAPTEPPSSNNTAPAPTPAPQAAEGSRVGLGQLRAIVSNLLPRRLSTSRRASIRSNGSSESNASNSIAQGGPRLPSGSLSPRAGIRAILHGPTALLRDLASHRPPDGENRGRESAEEAPPPQSQDDMPELESDSEDGSTYSEDDADQSVDDDMPSLEPIEGRTPAPDPAVPTTESWSSSGANAQGSESEPSRTASNGNQPRRFGPPRPPAPDNSMMDNIITLRIDLGHADGRDETIIVPLLFNPHGRNNNQDRPGEPRPTAAQPSRPRTPPPAKKWVPPEPIKTFRQVVEEKEREAGWRCDDPACLLGPADDEEPSDEHPIKPTYSIMRPIDPDEPVHYKIEDGIRVYAGGEGVRVKGENPVCAHTLHPECLVTSARVNGWGPDHNSKSTSRVTLRCPVCRLEGNIDRQIWDAGVQAEEAEV